MGSKLEELGAPALEAAQKAQRPKKRHNEGSHEKSSVLMV